MDLRHIKKIVNFLDAVAKDGNHHEDHILLMTTVIGVPTIDVGDVKAALGELEAVEKQMEMIEQLRDMLVKRAEEVNKMMTGLGGLGALPTPRVQLPEPEVAAIPLGHTGSLGVIELGHNG